ncbi:ferric reductase-like transmembrane domain-containing protein [Nocardioides sp. KIGAM211]|uniref:Ferric reductase-like transmembrane domain-containing protein n=1 Tax=Nocardioides luti TaxID=2761101 RepID=A0A7X0RIV5_9ACTN|nr:ferric reductase-like transmembrane domain-containing protein [Nocardioides luti]MBB6629092.1 ferric reductase-like transmembrane domain-containing protein [Nocardioides luti]
MQLVGGPGPSRRTDAAVASVALAVAALTLVVTTHVAFRSGNDLLLILRHPLTLQASQALWTGLASANLMILQVVCLARLPWLERAWGRGRLTRWHRWLGFWSFWLMVVHVGLFALQRVLRRPGRAGQALTDVFLREPWMLWATIGTVLIVLVVLTSLAVARARLRYETWHLLHLWAYVGMAAALPHMLVASDFHTPWVTAYWWGLYLGALGLVVAFRVVLPTWRSWREPLRVLQVEEEAAGAVSVVVGGGVRRLGARPGQFLVWRFLGPRGWSRGHPYSLSDAPTDTRTRITVGGSGDGALRLRSLTPGARVLVEGPYGGLPTTRRRHPHLVLMAAGVGITPLRSLLGALEAAPGEVTVLHRVRDDGDRLFAEEIDELATRHGVRVVVLAGPRRAPFSWLPAGVEDTETEALQRLLPDLLASDLLLCGPPGWSDAVEHAARLAGVRRRDLHREDFAW